MRTYTIRSIIKTRTIYQGTFSDFKECLESAVNKGADLSYADLSYKNLINANLDNGRLHYADFTGANLSGANLSESMISNANFSGATLFGTCLACSDIQHSSFEDTEFGGTDLTGSNISCSRFSGKSCFLLDFGSVKQMKDCSFKMQDGRIATFSTPPVVILGVKKCPVVIMEDAASEPMLLFAA